MLLLILRLIKLNFYYCDNILSLDIMIRLHSNKIKLLSIGIRKIVPFKFSSNLRVLETGFYLHIIEAKVISSYRLSTLRSLHHLV